MTQLIITLLLVITFYAMWVAHELYYCYIQFIRDDGAWALLADQCHHSRHRFIKMVFVRCLISPYMYVREAIIETINKL